MVRLAVVQQQLAVRFCTRPLKSRHVPLPPSSNARQAPTPSHSLHPRIVSSLDVCCAGIDCTPVRYVQTLGCCWSEVFRLGNSSPEDSISSHSQPYLTDSMTAIHLGGAGSHWQPVRSRYRDPGALAGLVRPTQVRRQVRHRVSLQFQARVCENELRIRRSSTNARSSLLVATGFRLASFDKLGFTVDPTLLEASYVCWTQTEMHYSVISATIPTATKFVKELNTHYGAAHGVPSNRNAYGSAYGSVSHVKSKRPRGTMRSDDVPLSTLKPGRKKISGTADSWDQFHYLGSEEDVSNRNEIRGTRHPPDFSTEASARGPDQAKSRPVDSTSVESGESQRMIIRKSVAWHVRRD